MATITYCTGFEGGVSPAEAHDMIILGTAPSAITFPAGGAPNSGARVLDMNVNAATCWVSGVQGGLTKTVTNTLVLGFAFKPSAMSVVSHICFFHTASGLYPSLNAIAPGGGATSIQDGETSALTAGPLTNETWYWVDWKLDVSANPWQQALKVTNIATGAVVYNSSNTSAETATTFDSWGVFGNQVASAVCHWQMDDLIFSNTVGDYPLGQHVVLGLAPNAYDAGNSSAPTNFNQTAAGTGGHAAIDSTSYSFVNTVPFPTAAPTSSVGRYIVKTTAGAGTDELAFALGWVSRTNPNVPAAVWVAYDGFAESSSGQTPSVKVLANGAGGTTTTLNPALAGTTPNYWGAAVTAPGGGWTNAALLASLIEYGFTTSTAVCAGGLMLEAALLPSTSATIQASELEYHYGGGGSATSAFGGAISSALISTGTANNIWDDITSGEASSGETTYACVFVKNNTVGGQTWTNPVVWIDDTPDTASSTAAVAVPTAKNTSTSTIADETDSTSQLSALSWASPTTKGTGVALGDLAPGDYRAVWIRRVIPAGAAGGSDAISIRCEGDTLVL